MKSSCPAERRDEKMAANNRADYTPRQETQPQFYIDSPLSKVGERTGKGRCHNLIGFGCNRNSRGDLVKNQQGSHQEPATHAKHTGQKAHTSAHAKQHEHIHRHFGNGQVKIHGAR